MGNLEDDKIEIMEAVRNAIGAALNEHKLGCPMAQNIQSLERIRADLYNGEDGKSGLSYEFRDFHSAWVQRTKDEDKAQAELLEERAALAAVPWVTVNQMGAVTTLGLDHGVPTASLFAVTAAVSVTGATVTVDYQAQP